MTPKVKIAIGVVVIILLGSLTGFMVSKKNKPKIEGATSAQQINTATEKGTMDTKTFRDTAKGKIEAGGLNGEGTHNLVRDGGPSQTVYLISSIVDLDQFVGKDVEVWGETLKAQKAGWLMDVGRVKLSQ